ncbi:MAG TPA: thioredoxin domain-containing protein, partial [Planctomycetota bacterium]|nr:thioredoxin domain-containing protein [Planctomycetota bacterium]
SELEAVLGRELGRRAAAWWGVSDEGNFEHGTSALWRERDADELASELKTSRAELESSMEQARAKLLQARARRVAPATDDKVLAAWNGLAISALAQAAQVLSEPRYLDAAREAARCVLGPMRQPDGRLFATARHGRARHQACLDDYAFVVGGLLDLYETDFDARWIEQALALSAIVQDEFADREHGGWFTTGERHETLLVRLKSPQDGALPSGNGVHALNLLRLAELTGRGELARTAQGALTAFGALVNRHPAAFSQLLTAVDFLAAGPREVVVAGARDDARTQAFLDALRGTFLPQRVVALADAEAPIELLPLLESKHDAGAPPRVFVCRHWSCRAPVASVDALLDELTD